MAKKSHLWYIDLVLTLLMRSGSYVMANSPHMPNFESLLHTIV